MIAAVGGKVAIRATYRGTDKADSSRHAGYQDLAAALVCLCGRAPRDERVQLGSVYIVPAQNECFDAAAALWVQASECPAAWTRCCRRSYGAGLPKAGRALELPGAGRSRLGRSTTPFPTGDDQAN
jgi:hypothetical protein